MSKTGKKLIASMREVLKVVQGDPEAVSKVRVTPSCGCVLCDLNLPPDEDGVHRSEKHPDVKCTKVNRS